MLRHMFCRPDTALLTLSPLLLLLAALFGMGLLTLPILVWAGLQPGQGALLPLTAIHGLLSGVATYAALRAARFQQVRVKREGERLSLVSAQAQQECALSEVKLVVSPRRFGLTKPITLYALTLHTQDTRTEWLLHLSLLRASAECAADRARAHLGLPR